MKFKYTDILIVRNLQTGDTDVVEAPAHRAGPGDLVTYGTSFVGKVMSAHWVGDDEDADSAYAMAKALAPHLYTATGTANLREVTPEVTPDEDT